MADLDLVKRSGGNGPKVQETRGNTVRLHDIKSGAIDGERKVRRESMEGSARCMKYSMSRRNSNKAGSKEEMRLMSQLQRKQQNLFDGFREKTLH
jgi:hypothetical protein